MLYRIMFIIFLFTVGISSAATINVPGDSATIQAGIDGAVEGDTVLVADGIYTDDGNRDIDFNGKNVVLKSVNGPGVTILNNDSGSSAHRGLIFQSGEDSSCIVEGFTITGCAMHPEGGGAVYCLSSGPTMIDCVIESNFSGGGGGVACVNSAITLIDCNFTNNATCWYGSAIYVESGGPINLVNCTFSNHQSSFTVHLENVSTSISNCTFSDNLAALSLVNCDATISNSTFHNNTNFSSLHPMAGGIIGWRSNIITIQNCTFAGNASGIASAICLDTDNTLNLANTIMAYGSSGVPIYCSPDDISDISCTDIYGNEDGDWVGGIESYSDINGNMSLDPLFCNRYSGNLAISSSSPCAPDHPENICQTLIGAEESIACAVSAGCGDANEDGAVNVSDAVSLVNYVFMNGDPPVPYLIGDVNCDGAVNICDAVRIINYIYMDGNAPCDIDGDGNPDC